MLKEAFDELLDQALNAIQRHYGDRLVTVAVYGSVGRGTMRFDSDVDLLVIVRDLPAGRGKRREEFRAVEDALNGTFRALMSRGIKTELTPIIKTPEEAEIGSPLFLDMVEDARILYDRDGFFARRLDRLRKRLQELGARRIWRGNVWYWDLKPDYQPGEVFEL
jgi:predicted nucleotidyltransferase